MRQNAETLGHIANAMAKQEDNIERVRFCFDVYLDHTENGALPTEHMDATKATAQLREALCSLLGYRRS